MSRGRSAADRERARLERESRRATRRSSGEGDGAGSPDPTRRPWRAAQARSRSVFAAPAALVLLGVGVYAYDASRSEVIAAGTEIGGIEVGGMRKAAARTALGRLQAKLERPVTVEAAGRRFVLSARRAGVRADLDAMVAEALKRSRRGNPLTRMLRGVTGRGVEVELRVGYSKRALEAFVGRVRHAVDRPARDARLAYSASGLRRVRERSGRRIRVDALSRELAAALVTPGARRLVRARREVEQPQVTKGELASRYPRVIVVDRGSFRLRLYKRLRLARTYPIGVGQAGYDTPSGLYRIQNKAVNPAWNVPQKAWAGELAGRLIPGGSPENPLKARWLGVYDGVGVHGTAETWSLGTSASHGCIRMAIPDVIALYEQVPVHTPIYIA